MEVKKTPKADLQNKKSIFGLFGLSVAIFLMVGAFSISQGEVTVNLDKTDEVAVEEDYMDITRPEEPPKPKVEKIATPAATSNVLEVIDNSVDLDDDMSMFDSEATEDSMIDLSPLESFEEDLLDEDIVVIKAEIAPKFLGGTVKKFVTWVQKNLKYPAEAELNSISGRVIALAVVGRDGLIRDVKILVSPDESLSKAVIDGIKASPKWEPAKQRGKPVSYQIQIAITFQQISR